MSITYPETQPSRSPKASAGAAIMNSGSALFPSGSTRVYERSAKARSGKSNLMLWIAAPVAVVLVGGAVLLSSGHHSAAPVRTTAIATRSVTTLQQPTPPVVAAPSEAAPAPVQDPPGRRRDRARGSHAHRDRRSAGVIDSARPSVEPRRDKDGQGRREPSADRDHDVHRSPYAPGRDYDADPRHIRLHAAPRRVGGGPGAGSP